MAEKKRIIASNDGSSVVFDYKPKDFPLTVTVIAKDFITGTASQATDFEISEIVAEQVGISQIKKKSVDDKVEEMALVRLKEIEERAYAESYQLGLIEGSEKAFNETMQELESSLNSLNQLMSEIEGFKTALAKENENQLIKLVYMIAQKVAYKEVEEHPEVIGTMIQEIVEGLQIDDEITLRVSAEDLMFLESLKEKVGRDSDGLKKVKFEMDPDVNSGGCVFETQYGVIDATIEQRVERVWASLSAKLPRISKSADSSGDAE